MKKKSLIFCSLIILSCLLLPNITKADEVTLSLYASKTDYKINDIFKVTVNVNNAGNQLQMARAKITYPADKLQAQDFALGDIFPIKSPGEKIGDGLIFSGGYLLGNGTNANGLLGTITFKVLKAGEARVAIVSGSNMITPEPRDIFSGGNSLNFTLSSENTASPAQSLIENQETTTPSMQAKIESEPNEDGSTLYRLFFSMTDELTNIYTYQLKFDGGNYLDAKSPYTLSSEEEKFDTVTIKAIDQTGHESEKIISLHDYFAKIFKLQDEKINLFDIQLDTVRRSWLEFYLIPAVIILIFIGLSFWLIIKKK
jgi:hypothetical protein